MGELIITRNTIQLHIEETDTYHGKFTIPDDTFIDGFKKIGVLCAPLMTINVPQPMSFVMARPFGKDMLVFTRWGSKLLEDKVDEISKPCLSRFKEAVLRADKETVYGVCQVNGKDEILVLNDKNKLIVERGKN